MRSGIAELLDKYTSYTMPALAQSVKTLSLQSTYKKPSIPPTNPVSTVSDEVIVESEVQEEKRVMKCGVDYPLLTRREYEVAKLVTVGLTNKEISVALKLSVKTVEKHRTHVMKKCDTHSIVKLTHLALARGWVSNLHSSELTV